MVTLNVKTMWYNTCNVVILALHEISMCFPANSYIIRIDKSFLDLQEDFDNATLVNTSSVKPRGSVENFEFKARTFRMKMAASILQSKPSMKANLTSEVSNIAQAIKFIPMPEDSVPALQYQDFCNQLGNFWISYDLIYI